jgi:hypothetical protein
MTLEVSEQQLDALSPFEVLELAAQTGLLVEDEKGFPDLIRARIKRALR